MTSFDVFQSIPFIRAFRSFFPSKRAFPSIGFLPELHYSFAYLREAMDFFWQRVQLPSCRVIVPAFICPIVPAVLKKNGFEPVFVDVDDRDFNLDWSILESMDLSNIGAILVCHTLGMPFDVARLRTIFKGMIVEDAAHAWGATWNGRPIGNEGDASFFSFYKQIPNLNGGVLISDQSEWNSDYLALPVDRISPSFLFHLKGPHQLFLDWLRRYRSLPKGDGLELRMPHRLHRMIHNLFSLGWEPFNKEKEGRAQVATWFHEMLGEEMVAQTTLDKKASPSYFRFTIRLTPPWAHLRDPLCLALRRQGIFVDRLWFNAPHHDHPVARSLATSVLNLPISASYDRQDIAKLMSTIRTILHSLKKSE